MGESKPKKQEPNEGQRRLDPELLKKGLRCDLDQYDMLKRCSEKRDMTEWNEWRKEHPDEDIWLQGRDFKGWWLKKANFSHHGRFPEPVTGKTTALTGQIHLEEANFDNAHLQDCNFLAAHLQNTDFTGAKLQGADFSRAIVDGGTLIWRCKVDRKTKFEGVGLDAARIYPELKQLLEYNIRRMNWEAWYKYKNWEIGKDERHIIVRGLMWFVRWFWWISGYGLSTGRIVGSFFVLALGFAAIYANCACWWPPSIVNNLAVEPHLPLWHYFLLVLLRPVYFSVVTMTTLGFGDMHANVTSIWGHVLLTIQVILGYVLLGALVTRFAVLFTAGGPAGKFADEENEG